MAAAVASEAGGEILESRKEAKLMVPELCRWLTSMQEVRAGGAGSTAGHVVWGRSFLKKTSVFFFGVQCLAEITGVQ